MYCGNSKIKRKVSLILAIGGVGKRMGLNMPKQFIEVEGKPIFIFPLEIAQKNDIIDEIIIVTTKESVEEVYKICKKFKISKVKEIVIGGKERQDSIYNAVKAIEKTDIVVVQDGVRPFLKERYIKECCEVVDSSNLGAVVGVKAKDTIKVVNSDLEVVTTPKRENLILVHTPQAFKFSILKKAYKKAFHEGFIGTDDASLVENLGEKVKIILGDYDNIKITTKEDLEILKNIYKV